jgi:cytoskeletal protein CcmA (bactofilin family)
MRFRSGGRGPAKVLLLLAAGFAVLLVATPAHARSDKSGLNENDQVVLNGRLDITADQTVDNAVILNGPARIDGTVRESVFVLNGDAEISGKVGEDVVVVNGDVIVRSTAEIDGDLVTNGSPTIEEGATIKGSRSSVVTRFDFEGLGVAGRFLWWLAYSVSVLAAGLLLLAIAPGLATSVREAVRRRTGASIGLGVAAFFLLPIASVILLVTVVGFPLGLFLLLALALIYTVGYTVALYAVGTLVLAPDKSRFLVFVIGWLIVRVVALIPFVGGLLWTAGAIWGLGLLIVSRRGTQAALPAAATAPPPPPPVAVPG